MVTRAATDASGKRRHPDARRWSGIIVAAAGAVLLVLGWYGTSGEALAAKQIPYLASASIPGAALVIAGAILLAGDLARRSDERAEAAVAVLYDLLTEPAGSASPAARAPRTAPATADGVVALPDSERFHRSGCTMVRDKPTVQAVTADEISARALAPCPVCEPSPPGS